MKILIVDDSKTARLHLKIPLEKAGFNVIEAASGDEGVAVVTAHKDPLDLIISDHNMPNKTGTDMVKEIRGLKDNVNANCNVLFLTSDSSPVIREQCMSLKAKAIVMKPVKPEALVAAVKKLLGVQ